MYTQSIILEEITREEYQQLAVELGIPVPSSGLYAKISNPRRQELNGTETVETYCQLFNDLLKRHPFCQQIRVRRKNDFVVKKKKNVRDLDDLTYVASLMVDNGVGKEGEARGDLFRLQYRQNKGDPRSMLSFRRFGNQLAGYALEMQYCHRELFDVRIGKEYSVVNGLWIPGNESADTIGAKSAERIRTEAKDTEEMVI